MLVDKSNIDKIVSDDRFFRAIRPPEIISYLKVVSEFKLRLEDGSIVDANPGDILVKYSNGDLDVFDSKSFLENFRLFPGALRRIK